MLANYTLANLWKGLPSTLHAVSAVAVALSGVVPVNPPQGVAGWVTWALGAVVVVERALSPS